MYFYCAFIVMALCVCFVLFSCSAVFVVGYSQGSVCVFLYLCVCICVFVYLCVCVYLCICVFVYLCICVFVYLSNSCIEGWGGDKVEQPGGFLSSSIVSQDRLIITKSPRSALLFVHNHDADVYLCFCIFVYLYICEFVYLCICVFVYLYICAFPLVLHCLSRSFDLHQITSKLNLHP